jgi:serine protease Do
LDIFEYIGCDDQQNRRCDTRARRRNHDRSYFRERFCFHGIDGNAVNGNVTLAGKDMSVAQSIACRIAIILLSTWAVIPLAAQGPTQPKTALDQLSSSLTKLAEQVAPAVVEIQVWSNSADDEDPSPGNVLGKRQIIGSGVILRSDGYIVSNAHVVAGAERVRVILNLARAPGVPVRAYAEIPERTYDAKIVGIDEETDLAVIKIDAKSLPTLPLANYDDLHQGQVVVAVGTPLGLKNVATMGIVSSVARRLEADSPIVYIQTDAAVNPGNSGGALVDTSGQLVGIVASRLNADRIGLAIPSDTVKFIFDEIRTSGRVVQGDIGLRTQTITQLLAEGLGLARKSGVVVSDVVPDFPAEKAGVRAQDVVLSMDGRSPEGAGGLATSILRKKPGESVSLRILRGTKEFPVEVPVVERVADLDIAGQPPGSHRNLIRALGVAAVDFGRDQQGVAPGVRVPSGVLVLGKCDDDDDMDSQLKPGDVIQSVNGNHVSSIGELVAALAKLPSHAAAVLRVERQKTFRYVVFEVR